MALSWGFATTACAVTFRFDDPAELDHWKVRTNVGDAEWRVDDGVLKVTSDDSRFTSVAVVRGVGQRPGSVSFSFRFQAALEVGAVFRLQPDPDPEGSEAYPGQYVYLDTTYSQLFWNQVRKWDLGHLVGNRLGGGLGVPAGVRRARDWTRIRIDFSSMGWHEVYLDTGGGLERVMGRQDVLNARVAAGDSELPMGGAGPPPVVDMLPVRDLVAAGDPLFGVGSVGLYAMRNDAGIGASIDFEDVVVEQWSAVADESSLPTVWAQLKGR